MRAPKGMHHNALIARISAVFLTSTCSHLACSARSLAMETRLNGVFCTIAGPGDSIELHAWLWPTLANRRSILLCVWPCMNIV